jgi:hypothetical protein
MGILFSSVLQTISCLRALPLRMLMVDRNKSIRKKLFGDFVSEASRRVVKSSALRFNPNPNNLMLTSLTFENAHS